MMKKKYDEELWIWRWEWRRIRWWWRRYKRMKKKNINKIIISKQAEGRIQTGRERGI